MLVYLSYAISLAAFVCYIIVIVKMFQNGKTGPGLFGLLGALLCGIGILFTFIYGWIKAKEFRITNIMIAWSVCFVLNIGLGVVTFPAMMQAQQAAMQEALQKQQNMNIPPPIQAPAIPGPIVDPAPAVPAPAPAPEPAAPETSPK